MNLQLSVYCDGGSRCNPGPAASAFIVKDSKGKILHQQGFYLGTATNNQAEYQAVIFALRYLTTHYLSHNSLRPTEALSLPKGEGGQLTTYNFYLDSQLVVNQLTGNFKIKDQVLKKKYLEIRNYLEQLGQLEIRIIFNYVPRSQNYLADKLVNETLDFQRKISANF